MQPLDGPRLKIRRAESEIEAFRLAEETFRQESNYHVVRAEFNPKSGKYVYRFRVDRTPPLEWGVDVGEIAHNLRSALDGLVYQLVLLNGNTPTTNTQFPVFLAGTTKTKRGSNLIPHFQDRGRRMLNGVRQEHQTFIERLQPYHRNRGGRNNPLWLLTEINNADKHRLIQVVGAKIGILFSSFWMQEESPGPLPKLPIKILKDGAKFMEFNPNVHVNPKVIPLIAFSDGCPPVKSKAVVNTLRIIANEVSQIIEDFASEFD